MKKKRFVIRNLVWNIHFTDYLDGQNDHEKIVSLANKFLSDLKEDKRINYCVFSVERGKRQNNFSFHLQGYSEFDRSIDGTSFKNEWNLSDIQARKGTQQQAIDYVKKERSKILDKIFEFGIPKKQSRELRKYNLEDEDIHKDMDLQRILLNHRLKENYYQHFSDIEKDFELLFIKNEKWCKNLWDRYHPVKKIDVLPARTIWIYGNSGIGKTTWTNNYLKENGYSDQYISKKKASSESKPRLWYDLEDEKCSVLWIEEIRENFPEFNDVIQLIDKGTRLEVKGSHIDNNFDLIIFNSLHSPEFVYRSLPFGHQVEILRRIYRGRESKVYQLIPDKKNFNYLNDKTNFLPKVLEKHFSNQEEQSENPEELII